MRIRHTTWAAVYRRNDPRDGAVRIHARELQELPGIGDEDFVYAKHFVTRAKENRQFLVLFEWTLHGLDLRHDGGAGYAFAGALATGFCSAGFGAAGVRTASITEFFRALRYLIGEGFARAADRHAFDPNAVFLQ